MPSEPAVQPLLRPRRRPHSRSGASVTAAQEHSQAGRPLRSVRGSGRLHLIDGPTKGLLPAGCRLWGPQPQGSAGGAQTTL